VLALLAWSVWLSPWEWSSSDWAGLTFLVVAAGAFVAGRQVKEARRLREAQAQPFVIVDFEVDERNHGIYLVISNIGGTMARNVQLKFDPELTSSLDSNPNVVPPRDLKPLRDKIPSLPPGKRISIMFDIFTERDATVYPDLFNVEITFDAPALKKRDVRDDSVLDLGVYRDTLHPMRRDIHDVHERLKELVAEVKRLGR
jgi:hypothetical protein